MGDTVVIEVSARAIEPPGCPPEGAGFDGGALALLRAELAEMGLLEASPSTVILEKYGRWLEESRQVLAENSTRLAAPALDVASAWREWEGSKGRWTASPYLGAQCVLLEKTLHALPEILTGRVRATDVMFPNGAMSLVEGIYKDNPVADYFNDVVRETVVRYIEARLTQEAGARVRILEIGAGTGGTSVRVLAGLAPYREQVAEYCYTDLSQAFLLHAREAYGAQHPFLSYRLFDVEQAPEGQGIEAGAYDVVIAWTAGGWRRMWRCGCGARRGCRASPGVECWSARASGRSASRRGRRRGWASRSSRRQATGWCGRRWSRRCGRRPRCRRRGARPRGPRDSGREPARPKRARCWIGCGRRSRRKCRG
ncbi:MAG: class I SAM-dependent methyltransferase [Chloroflexi bacterium]|nr:MAG: class I SAM-dependent methyltransferase [Chloroflexota bacterium]